MLECDLIMKGGITSGIVYPHAIVELSQKYRFRCIGGTSAGAIAAAFAAAAEYRRQAKGGSNSEGFDQVARVADELGSDMRTLFQPSPTMRPLFRLLLALVSQQAKDGRPVFAILRALPGIFTYSIVIGLSVLLTIIIAAILATSFWLGVLGLIVALLTSASLIAFDLYRLVFVHLPQHDFGICSGRTFENDAKLGFSDWIANRIDEIAGNLDAEGRAGDPLTIGQLRAYQVDVATMSTDISSGRPYQLPLRSEIHFFSKKEFDRLLPARIVNFLCRTGGPREARPSDKGLPDDLYRLPTGDDFPVVLIARMSLSFPFLIRAVPLYRVDYEHRQGRQAPLRRCLFSDGGISSNFPIHFFDSMLPSRPTFGITLTSWDQARDGEERIHLPKRGRQSTSPPVNQIVGISGFLFAILNTAKDWQDTLQSLLVGYAERIVTIRLDDRREGGMNLEMDSETIDKLAEFGRCAGKMLKVDFDFDQHRYDRAISVLPALEDSLERLHYTYEAISDDDADRFPPYNTLLTDYKTAHYENSGPWRRDPFARLASDLAAIGERAAELHQGKRSIRSGNVPSIDSQIRLVATADRVPREARSPEE